jgi:hypothetical protein
MDGVLYRNANMSVTGTIEHLTFSDGDDLSDLEVVHGTIRSQDGEVGGQVELAQKRSGLHARRIDGHAVTGLTFRVQPGARNDARAERTGIATASVLRDFGKAHEAIDAMAADTLSGGTDALGRKPFRRASVLKALFDHLGHPGGTWCCIDEHGMPEAVSDDDPRDHDALDDHETSADVKLFQRYCGACHHEQEPFPPNFLHGTPAQVKEQVDHCAERIRFRLEMWRLPPADRPEAPMPPVAGLVRLNVSPEQWPAHSDLAKLNEYVTRTVNPAAASLSRDDLLSHEYDTLRECLPAAPH